MAVDRLVDGLSQLFRRVIVATQRLAQTDMHPPLEAHDPRDDAVDILELTLLIAAALGPFHQLARLGLIARIEFVRDGHRDNIQALHVLGKAALLLLARHVEHLEDRRIRLVIPILGPPLFLGNPDGVAIAE